MTAIMPIFDKARRYIASHSQPPGTQGIRPTLDELMVECDAVLKAWARQKTVETSRSHQPFATRRLLACLPIPFSIMSQQVTERTAAELSGRRSPELQIMLVASPRKSLQFTRPADFGGPLRLTALQLWVFDECRRSWRPRHFARRSFPVRCRYSKAAPHAHENSSHCSG